MRLFGGGMVQKKVGKQKVKYYQNNPRGIPGFMSGNLGLKFGLVKWDF